jgi:DNA-binding NarL/FixJ family response regulator
MTDEALFRVTRFRMGASELVVASFPAPAVPSAKLTVTERRLLEGLLRGRSEPALAREAGRSLATIRHQVESIYRKLCVHSRAELLRACSVGNTACRPTSSR